LVPRKGFEPPTHALRMRCRTTSLSGWRAYALRAAQRRRRAPPRHRPRSRGGRARPAGRLLWDRELGVVPRCRVALSLDPSEVAVPPRDVLRRPGPPQAAPGVREDRREALTGECTGRAIEPRKGPHPWGADAVRDPVPLAYVNKISTRESKTIRQGSSPYMAVWGPNARRQTLLRGFPG
jgi:hypothetical protein